jgi:hypothetical protein
LDLRALETGGALRDTGRKKSLEWNLLPSFVPLFILIQIRLALATASSEKYRNISPTWTALKFFIL